MIHIDLRLPSKNEKNAEEPKAFSETFFVSGKGNVLPSAEKIAKRLIRSFKTEKDEYVDSVKLDLIYKSSDPCNCLPEIHRLLTGVAALVDTAKGGPARKVLGESYRIVKGMSTHYERIEEIAQIQVTVSYKTVDVLDLIHRPQPYVGVMGA